MIVRHSTDEFCPGVQIVRRGRARVFMCSPEGKQLTLQRITDNEPFVIGVSCMLNKTIFDVSLETETECEIAVISREICRRLFDANPAVRNACIGIIAQRFSKTMRVLGSVTFLSMRSRLAGALIEQSVLAGSPVFEATHAGIAADIGSVREVVTKVLRKFQAEGFVTLLRGKIRIEDMQALENIRGDQ